jgi:hypothetical protein
MIRVVWVGFLCALIALGQGKGKGKGKQQETNSASSAGLDFGNDADLIRQYCRGLGTRNLPPGLAKRGGDLPPGLEKQLRRNGRLPPGLEKRLDPFPPELERRLAPLPPDYGRAFIGGRAVIYNKSTSLILDVFVPL